MSNEIMAIIVAAGGVMLALIVAIVGSYRFHCTPTSFIADPTLHSRFEEYGNYHWCPN